MSINSTTYEEKIFSKTNMKNYLPQKKSNKFVLYENYFPQTSCYCFLVPPYPGYMQTIYCDSHSEDNLVEDVKNYVRNNKGKHSGRKMPCTYNVSVYRFRLAQLLTG